MHDIPERLADVLLEVEAILRRTGKWEGQPPPEGALDSSQPFCLDTLEFEQWLQWILLPSMKQILENRKPLPGRSGITEYAEECLPRHDPQMLRLLEVIKRFDDLISIQAGQKLH